MKEKAFKSGTYSNIISERRDGPRRIVRKETSESTEELRKEIEYLLGLPPHLEEYFPEVIRCSMVGLPVFYEMPLYNYSTLRSLILKGAIGVETALALLERIVAFTFRLLYKVNQMPAGTGWLHSLHIKRIENRLREVSRISDIFRPFIEADRVRINGNLLPNILPILDKIAEDGDFINSIQPRYTSMVHGDFHFDNFLVDPDTLKFILLDPRGESRGYDWTYDYGKLWTSFDGKYDFMHEGLFELESDDRGRYPEIRFEYDPHRAAESYNEISKRIIPLVGHYVKEYGDHRLWLLRVKAVEALHFCAVAPFHLEGDGWEKRALCRYATGVFLLNEVCTSFRDG